MGKTNHGYNTPGYITASLQPIAGAGTDRRVWGIPLNGVWIPFFLATNTQGNTAIASEALGAPLRLQREDDGTPKFSKTGRPVIRVVKALADQVRIVRDNHIAGYLSFVSDVRKANPEQFQAQVEAAQKAGEPITRKDDQCLADYLDAKAEAAAEKVEAEAKKVVAEANATMADAEKELVPA